MLKTYFGPVESYSLTEEEHNDHNRLVRPRYFVTEPGVRWPHSPAMVR